MESNRNTALFVIDSFHIGGAVSFLRQHVEAAVNLGLQVVIIGGKGNLQNPTTQFPGAKIVELSVSEGYGSLQGRCIWFISMVRAIHDVYRTNTVVFCYSPLLFSSLALLSHGKTWKIPRIYAFCGNVAMELLSARLVPSTIRFQIKLWLITRLQKFVVARFTHILTFSSYAKKLLTQTLDCSDESKIVVICGYVKSTYRKKQRVQKTVRLLAISRFEPRKGLDLLLHTAFLLKKHNCNFTVTIAGAYDPIYLNVLFELYEKLNLFTHIRFIHAVSEDQMNQLFDASDICIVPSKDLETFGMLTIQALARGVPVIGTPVGATPQILAPISKYLLASSPDSHALEFAIKRFISLPQKKKVIVYKKMQSIIASRYSQTCILPQLENFFQNLF